MLSPACAQFTGKNTFFGKTANLLQQGGGELGHLQKILLLIMFVLLAVSFTLCLTCFGYLLGKGTSFKVGERGRGTGARGAGE